MIGKKVVALVVVAGLTASIGLTATASPKYTAIKTKAKVVHGQRVDKFKAGIGLQDMKTKLDALVKGGTITQALEDKVVTYLNQQEAARKAEMDKVKAMTAAERKAYFDSKVKTKRTGILAGMVKSGTITQAEADSLKAALPKMVKDKAANMKTKLDALVKAGTITQANEDAVIAYFNQLDTARKAEMDKVKAMTDAERKAYFASKTNTAKPDPMADLVKAGTLTQAQADAIKKVLPGHGGFGKKGHGRFGGKR